MMELTPSTLLFTFINLMILLFILTKLLYKPVKKIIEEREALVNGQLDDAKRIQTEAIQMKNEYVEQLETAHAQASDIINAARTRATDEHDQIIAQTREESERMLQKAKGDIKTEQAKAELELQSRIAELALTAARKIIKTGDVHDANSNE